MSLLSFAEIFWLVFGVFFLIAGVVGVIRLPDAFSRLHASGKVGTMGLLGILLGAGFVLGSPGSILKIFALGFFIAITAPVATHAIAKADREYSVRQKIARDSSISGEGDQAQLQSTSELEAVSVPEAENAESGDGEIAEAPEAETES